MAAQETKGTVSVSPLDLKPLSLAEFMGFVSKPSAYAEPNVDGAGRFVRNHPGSRQSSFPAQSAQDGEGSASYVLG